ncbi:MAG TPA: hypothetical protein VN752_10335 [Solirubrobacterales bacterium]|nr:hypothetical protein [Solirubrobacterales bacterium]
MSNTRGGLGRLIALGVSLALALLLLGAKEASAGKYSVAQCGWRLGADAGWADSTGGAKFRPDAYCATPVGTDPFDGAHLKSFTRDGQATVSGTRYARWRWDAPPGTGITRVSGTWWHALHDGMEQRIGVGTWNGGFDAFAVADVTDVTPRNFVAGFDPAMPALEDRLLCARAESKSCSLNPGSWSAIRALTITVQDDYPPGSAIGGELLEGGWQRGIRKLGYSATDIGAGLRRTEVVIDGVSVFPHDHPCNAAVIGSELRATTMRPCPTDRVGYYPLTTNGFSDGPHSLSHCATDFAGNPNCLPARTVLIDNNPPAHPRNPVLAGGEAWRRTNDFDLTWTNPDQGPASPIAGVSWRVKAPDGQASSARFVAGRDVASLKDLFVLRAGVHVLEFWLRDEAGNEAPATASAVPLRFDDVPPGVAFQAAAGGEAVPTQVEARIADLHSGPASGEIHFRRLDGRDWAELPAKLQRQSAETSLLVARLPGDLGPGTYVFRADAVDGAGNTATTTRRADGAEMTIRKVAGSPLTAIERAEPLREKTRIFARIRWRRLVGSALTVPFRATATVHGRLLSADGAGLGGRSVRVVERPSRGALRKARARMVETGPHGGFELGLRPGPSRRIAISFSGETRLEEATRRPLTLRVRGGVDFQVAPRLLRTGEAIRLTGRVRTLGAPLPRRGKLVAIQYFEQATKRWRPVLVTRTDHNGRFRARYRFRYVSGTATIRLRAAALAEERWPYAPGISKPILVRVTG